MLKLNFHLVLEQNGWGSVVPYKATTARIAPIPGQGQQQLPSARSQISNNHACFAVVLAEWRLGTLRAFSVSVRSSISTQGVGGVNRTMARCNSLTAESPADATQRSTG